MRAVVLRSLAVVGIGGLVLAGVLYLASTVDGRAPAVLSVALTQPLPDDPAVGLPTTSLEVTFSEVVEHESAAGALRIEPAVPGSVSWSGSVMIFTPRDPLELATAYTVTVDAGVTDPSGNRMTEMPPPFTFETTGPPTMVESVPVDDATGVALDAPITIRFSGLMDTASVEAALRLRPIFPHAVRWAGQVLEIMPTEPLRPDTPYRVEIGVEAFDVSGVALDEPIRVAFRTVAPGLDPAVLVPADGADGVARTSPIAVIFSGAIDPETISGDLFQISPEVSGSVELLDADAEATERPDGGVILAFTPSGPLPPNTTFEVRLGGAIAGRDGGGLAEDVTWTFTTGVSQPTLTNQIVFLSDRSGVANLWAMNADGTAARQLSAELAPIVDYAVAPDGSSFVVGDGRRLVMQDADGSDRRVLTDDGALEFDPAYAPNGQRLAFARASAADGSGLGIWERTVPGDAESPLALPAAWTEQDDDRPHRAPSYAPDGRSLAFVDATGWVAIVNLEDETASRARFDVQAPILWTPDATSFVVTGRPVTSTLAPPAFEAPVVPLEPGRGGAVSVVNRASGTVDTSAFGAGAVALAVDADGRIAYRDADGELRLADRADAAGRPVTIGADAPPAVSFSPAEDAMVIVVPRDGSGGEARGALVRVNLTSGSRDILANDGWRPRWLP